jgi:hypothetical protein
MPERERDQEGRKPATGRGLVREVSYLHPDEAEALKKRADLKRVSKAEIIRRALRAYLDIED